MIEKPQNADDYWDEMPGPLSAPPIASGGDYWNEMPGPLLGVKARHSGLDQPRYVSGRKIVGMGWQPDIPDFRDRTLQSAEISKVAKSSGSSLLSEGLRLPKKHNTNIRFCSPVEDQESLGSCTSNAVIGMMEYLQRRGGIKHVNLSRLFLYKVTRRLLGWKGDTGAYIRTTLQATAAFGIPPETNFPYDIDAYELEPEAFHYAYAANFKALNYARLDPPEKTGKSLLNDLKRVIHAGHVVAFGFTVFDSISGDSDIPFPDERDTRDGGHAVLAVGYDDDRKMPGTDKKGAIIIRNSWGESWGDRGYGYLPYEYFTRGLARDFWVVFKSDWIDTSAFKNS